LLAAVEQLYRRRQKLVEFELRKEMDPCEELVEVGDEHYLITLALVTKLPKAADSDTIGSENLFAERVQPTECAPVGAGFVDGERNA